ncbi:MAG: nucleotidyl transferase AbiEii/AbiGii toxin family protein [Nitrosotalea sp.]
MIASQVLKKLARQWNLNVDAVEKHYILGWILYGISKSSIGKCLVFKGGTALSKIYFPSDWRLSEDLDFTVLDDTKWNAIVQALDQEVPPIVQRKGEITISLRKNPHTNPGYLQVKIKYNGPISPGTVKIEISKEQFIGTVVRKTIPNNPEDFDYPKFSAKVYSPETIVGEKTRAILQRGYIRDYYDVWRLFKENKFDQKEALNMFNKKCVAKDVKFSNVEEFFPDGIADILKEHLPNLMRLVREKPPPIKTILDELRKSLNKFFA